MLHDKILHNRFIIPATLKAIIASIAEKIGKPVGELVREGSVDMAALLTTNVSEKIVENKIALDISQREEMAALLQPRLNFGMKKPFINSLMDTVNFLDD